MIDELNTHCQAKEAERRARRRLGRPGPQVRIFGSGAAQLGIGEERGLADAGDQGTAGAGEQDVEHQKGGGEDSL